MARKRPRRLAVYPATSGQLADGTRLPSEWSPTASATGIPARVDSLSGTPRLMEVAVEMANPHLAEVAWDDRERFPYGAKVVDDLSRTFVVAGPVSAQGDFARYAEVPLEGVSLA